MGWTVTPRKCSAPTFSFTVLAMVFHAVFTAAAVRSLRRIKLLRDSADATVWITHDPDDWAELRHAPHSYE